MKKHFNLISLLLLLLLSPATKSGTTQKNSVATDQSAILTQIYQLVDQRKTDVPLFSRALNRSDVSHQTKVLVLLGRLGDQQTVDIILSKLNNMNSSVRRAAVFALGQMPAKTERSELVQALTKHIDKESDPVVRAEIWLSLGRLAPSSLLKIVMQNLPTERSTQVRGAMFQGLAIATVFHPDRLPGKEKIPHQILLDLLSSGESDYAPAGLFLSRLKSIGQQLSLTQLLGLTSRPLPESIRIQLIRLVRLTVQEQFPESESDATYAVIRKLLSWIITESEDPSLNIQIEAARALVSFWSIPQAKVQLGKLQGSGQPLLSSETLFALADSTIDDEFLVKLFKQHLKNERAEMQLAAIRGLIKRQEKSDMSWILSILRNSSSFNRIRLIALLKEKAKEDKKPKEFDNFIRFLTQDRDPKVAAYAQSRLDNKKAEQETPNTPPEYPQVKQATTKKIRLLTNVGKIDIQMLSDAPYTAWQIVELVRQHYFDGTYFHRVIGNFVAQGGDPIGDGEGSSGLTIREEINYQQHEPLTVGIATAGKDTGSSQFFINTARNYHLDRNYTIFGKVVSEPVVLERLVLGTQILKAEVIE